MPDDDIWSIWTKEQTTSGYNNYIYTPFNLRKEVSKVMAKVETIQEPKPAKPQYEFADMSVCSLRDYGMVERDGIMEYWTRGVGSGRKVVCSTIMLNHLGNHIGGGIIVCDKDNEFHCNTELFITNAARRNSDNAIYLMEYLVKKLEDDKFREKMRSATGWTIPQKVIYWTGTPEREEFAKRFLEKYPNSILTTNEFTPA